MREHDYSVIELPGSNGDAIPVEVLLVVEKRRKLSKLLQMINQIDPDAMYTISDVKRQYKRTDLAPGRKYLIASWLFRVKRK